MLQFALHSKLPVIMPAEQISEVEPTRLYPGRHAALQVSPWPKVEDEGHSKLCLMFGMVGIVHGFPMHSNNPLEFPALHEILDEPLSL